MDNPVAYNLIAGAQKEGAHREAVDNPANVDEIVGYVEVASTALVDAAVDSAHTAFPRWAATPLSERKALLEQATQKVEKWQSEHDIPLLLTREQGKILAEARRDAYGAIPVTRLNIDLADAAITDRVTEDEQGRNILVYDPIGVVAVVTPWNWPVLLTINAVAPALLAGNSVVVKPAPNTPLVVTETLRTMASALPLGLLNVVQGGADVGGHLVSHPKVGKVTFVGSVASGRKVYQSAGESTIKRLALELGGNDPALIFGDTKLDDSVIRALVDSTYMTTGQACIAIKRLYVHSDIIGEFTDKFLDAANEAVVGNGADETVTIGPLNNAMQYDKVRMMVRDADQAGATIREVGRRAPGTRWDKGHFLLPSVALNAPEDSALVTDEQFGPVVPILEFSDTDDVIARANDTHFGLSASIWSADTERAFAVARRLEAGKIWLNQHGLGGLDFGIAVGGVKNSGLGVHYGPEGIQAFTNRRLLTDRRL